MTHTILQLNRKRRWLRGQVPLADFVAAAELLQALANKQRLRTNLTVVTCGTQAEYNASNGSWNKDAQKILAMRRNYSLDDLTKEVWAWALKVELYMQDRDGLDEFVVCLSCDRYAEPKLLSLYGVGLLQNLRTAIVQSSFYKADGVYTVDHGQSTPELNNLPSEVVSRYTSIPSGVMRASLFC